MTTVTLHHGDNREHLRRLIAEGVRVHSVVCDPPYGLTSITKRFGKEGAAPAKFGSDGAFSRASAGFMGSKWDGTGIERDPEFWRLILEILLPGGYVVAFSGSRTGHWQACAMEMAGFIMHPFLGWAYGQGMPKAHNAAMAIDKSLGVEGTRGQPKTAAHAGWIARGRMRGHDNHEGWQRPWMEDEDKVASNARRYLPGSPEAVKWDGWAYGGQALNPALEPIYVGQKPFSEKNGPLNFLKHGVGAINIDGCRDASGRHPSNIMHDGSPDVIEMLVGKADLFTAFPLDCNPVFYCPKATKDDRAGSKHPTVKPVSLMEWLVTLVTPPGGTVLDPFAGSGTTGQAASNLGFDCILMEAEDQFAEDIRRRFNLPCPTAANDDFDSLMGDEFAELLG